MLDPVGPLPSAVYWRRRAVALLAIVLSVVLIFWVVSQLASASGEPTSAAGASSSSSSTSSSPFGSGGSGGDAGAADAAASDSDASGDAGTDGDASSTGDADSTGDGGAAAEQPAESADASQTAAAETPAAEPTQAAPTVCAPESIQVLVSAESNVFVKGSKPKLTLSVVNAGQVACYRDLNAAGQEITIWDAAGNRLWSSNDCYPEASDDTRLLEPGQKVDYTLVWSGKVSEPTCTAARPLLGAGQYLLMATQDGVASAQVPFSITE